MYKAIKAALEAVPELSGKVFPVGFITDKVRGACCCYSVEGPDPVRSMSGRVLHWSAKFTADVLAPDYDDCQSIYMEIQTAMETIAALPGMLTLEVTCPEIDAWAAEVDRFRKRVVIALEWRY